MDLPVATRDGAGVLRRAVVLSFIAPLILAACTSSTEPVRATADHSCARATTGQLWCWGNDTEGQIGTGSGSGRFLVPTLVRP